MTVCASSDIPRSSLLKKAFKDDTPRNVPHPIPIPNHIPPPSQSASSPGFTLNRAIQGRRRKGPCSSIMSECLPGVAAGQLTTSPPPLSNPPQGNVDSSISVSISKRPAPRGTAAYPRKRANKACQVCRARRTKCDNKKPSCSFCEKVGTQCVWAPDDLSS